MNQKLLKMVAIVIQIDLLIIEVINHFKVVGNCGKGFIIHLNNNQLTRFESDVFLSVLEKLEPFAPYNARMLISNSK